MNPVDVFGSGVCAVVMLFCAAIGMMLEINRFIEKHWLDGDFFTLVLSMLRGIVIWAMLGQVALWFASFLAVNFGG